MKRFFPNVCKVGDGGLLPEPPPEKAWFVGSMIVLFGMAFPHKAPRAALRPALPRSTARANSKADMRKREVMPSSCLVSFEIAFGVSIGVGEHYGVGTAGQVGEGDDDRLLNSGVRHGVVNHVAHGIVDGNADITETLVEVDVDRVVIDTRYNGVRVCTDIKSTLQYDDLISSRNVVFHINNGIA